MASLFEGPRDVIRLLDAGAGAGFLTSAFIRRICSENKKPKKILVTAYEVDPKMIVPLQQTLLQCMNDCENAGVEFSSEVIAKDFISTIAPTVRKDDFSIQPETFNFAIVNPPYKKIKADSNHRKQLLAAGIETTNLYSGFLSLISKLLVQGGELVAITPRSFCNGPYFKKFRASFLENMSLRKLHVFESRSVAFKSQKVLQENLIIHAIKGESKPVRVTVSVSSGAPDSRLTERRVKYSDIVSPRDPEQFIHLPVSNSQKNAAIAVNRLPSTLTDLGLQVSTGRVVDFRAEEFLRMNPEKGTAPLIYPTHFNGGTIHWPKLNSRKPNAIKIDEHTKNFLIPAGIYVVVKRFTAKEERRRIVACLYDPVLIQAQLLGFENHLNYFHMNGKGLPKRLAKGLIAYLNSTVVDAYFRQFSGHTQVNATDLRNLKYPSAKSLDQLGNKIDEKHLSQDQLDALIEHDIL